VTAVACRASASMAELPVRAAATYLRIAIATLARKRYLDNLLGFTRSHTTLSQSLFPKSDPVKSGERELQSTTAVPYFGAGLSEHLTGGSRYDFHNGND
jgi:hypothetical protein